MNINSTRSKFDALLVFSSKKIYVLFSFWNQIWWYNFCNTVMCRRPTHSLQTWPNVHKGMTPLPPPPHKKKKIRGLEHLQVVKLSWNFGGGLSLGGLYHLGGPGTFWRVTYNKQLTFCFFVFIFEKDFMKISDFPKKFIWYFSGILVFM